MAESTARGTPAQSLSAEGYQVSASEDRSLKSGAHSYVVRSDQRQIQRPSATAWSPGWVKPREPKYEPQADKLNLGLGRWIARASNTAACDMRRRSELKSNQASAPKRRVRLIVRV
jgi:hypothetical protein